MEERSLLSCLWLIRFPRCRWRQLETARHLPIGSFSSQLKPVCDYTPVSPQRTLTCPVTLARRNRLRWEVFKTDLRDFALRISATPRSRRKKIVPALIRSRPLWILLTNLVAFSTFWGHILILTLNSFIQRRSNLNTNTSTQVMCHSVFLSLFPRSSNTSRKNELCRKRLCPFPISGEPSGMND